MHVHNLNNLTYAGKLFEAIQSGDWKRVEKEKKKCRMNFHVIKIIMIHRRVNLQNISLITCFRLMTQSAFGMFSLLVVVKIKKKKC